ncbi:uncharacterized protein LOC124798587 [Schistocerca piceifrons]|uniref:uncharacterized protein LOC124798587 n=1 Tax=Schistocerca piceifrons TaxID=274613 RepID=UPI001F5E9127|nr:uncharacterized protein LOC124798587 [Schistocerca piceifrons]
MMEAGQGLSDPVGGLSLAGGPSWSGLRDVGMGRWAVLAVVLVWTCLVSAQVDQPYKDIKINGVAPCDDNDELVVAIREHAVERIDRSVLEANATTEVTKELPVGLSVKVEFTRCDSKSQPSSCSLFFEEEFDDFCDRINDPNTPWSNAVKTTSPPVECPVQPDTFLTLGTLIDATTLDNAPEGYWTAKLQAVRDGETVFCLLADAKIIEVVL